MLSIVAVPTEDLESQRKGLLVQPFRKANTLAGNFVLIASPVDMVESKEDFVVFPTTDTCPSIMFDSLESVPLSAIPLVDVVLGLTRGTFGLPCECARRTVTADAGRALPVALSFRPLTLVS